MGVEFDTLTGEPLDASQSYVHTLSDESGFYGQTFVATSANLSQIEFGLDTWEYGTAATFTVMIATVRFDSNGMHPDEVLFESALITVSPDNDDLYDVMSVSVSGVELVPGQRYVILFNSNAGDGNGAAGMRFATNPSDDDGNFVYRHTPATDPADETVFAEDWYEDNLNGGSGWGDIAIRLTYNSANVIDGTEGDDTLIGTSGDDQINGYGGSDYIRGAEGNDELNGGDGDDYLAGGEGDDVINGGDGFDRAAFSVGATGGVTVDLNLQGSAQDTGQGMDTLTGIEHVSGTRFDDVITGDAGDNWLWGGSDGSGVTGNDTISGGDGNDLVQVGTGNHILDGGDGIDTLSLHGNATDITSDGVTVSLGLQGGAQDTEQGSMTITGFENLSGSTYDDHLTGDGGDNLLAGDAGDDTLVGGAGNDTLYGDGAVDVDGFGNSGQIITVADTGAAGNDTLEGGLGDDYIDGGAGNDTASYANAAGAVEAYLYAGAAYGADGNDTLVNIENLIGSAYGDWLFGDDNSNVIFGEGGNDTLVGLGGDDTLHGGDGHDYLEGNDGNDQLYGGADDDFLYGNAGDDLIDGGDGYDRAGFSFGATSGVTVDLNLQGTAQDTGQGWDTLVNIEHVSGTRFSDTIIGDAGDNWLWGGSDGSGVTGDDTISGGDGNDLVTVGAGNHMLDGGAGNDTLSLYGNTTDISSAGVTFSLALQGSAQDSEQGMMTATGFENLVGSIHADHLTGDAGDNILAGAEGDDTLVGGDGNDTLYGDGIIHADTHGTGRSGPIVTVADTGAAGNDTLEGGKGDDTLYGGGGNDVLTGSQGRDTFVFSADSGDDVITDFGGGQDTIVFDSSSGVSDFSQLTFTKSGRDMIVTWGTDDSIVLQGVKPKDIDPSSFQFEGASMAMMAFESFDSGLATIDVGYSSGDYML